ncbi:cytidine triphosphate synthase [Trypanosoma theileri]|uniref:Cytidine triphosphate synthase n=1 Tax=Trypanosoma theileri TaxID=67003 RepID=A0A1X0NWF3_9TRYP|nr:cytidine triphosphate synthase [Trypanosoma theileri]ORC89027.1 cytidine triphosphate synthase [Trypanosoma theileri]
MQEQKRSANAVAIMDGAMGTLLEDYGVDMDKASPMWSSTVLLSNPELVQRAHQAYIDAGCDVLLTCTYQMFEEGCTASGVTMSDLVDSAVKVARLRMPLRKKEVNLKLNNKWSNTLTGPSHIFAPLFSSLEDPSERYVLLAGSLGPYGCSFPGGHEYRGDYEVNDSLIDTFHGGRLLSFVGESGEKAFLKVDFLILETFPKLDEAVKVLLWMQQQKEFPNKILATAPVCLSFVSAPIESFFPEDGDDKALSEWWELQESQSRLPDGNTFEDALIKLQKCNALGLAGIGCNCSLPLEVSFMASVMLKKKRLDKENPLALLIYPNSGEFFGNGEWYYKKEIKKDLLMGLGKEEVDSIQTLKRKLATGHGDICTSLQFILQLLHQRDETEDWLFKVILYGGCCRSTPEDTTALKRVCLGS